jgi:hypothetical protein
VTCDSEYPHDQPEQLSELPVETVEKDSNVDLVEQWNLPSVSQERIGEKEVAGEPTTSNDGANSQLQDILSNLLQQCRRINKKP